MTVQHVVHEPQDFPGTTDAIEAAPADWQRHAQIKDFPLSLNDI
jgi:hypothetical protein